MTAQKISYLLSEDRIILLSVVLNLTAEELEELDGLITEVWDWDVIYELLLKHGSVPLIFKKLPLLSNRAYIPVEIQHKLQHAYFKTLTRSMLLQYALKTVLEILQEEKIKVVVLKGAYLSQELYGDIALRQFSDIDILVTEEDGPTAVNLLLQQGYAPYDPSVSEFIASQTEIVHYPPLVKEGVSVEVHIRLHRKSDRYKIRTEEFIMNAVPFTVLGVHAYGLALYDLIIHLCVHMDKHFRGGHIQMKCFNDIVNIILLKENEISWSDFIETCRIHSCEKSVFKYILLTAEFYAVALPENILQSYSTHVTNSDRELFVKYLHCEYEEKYHVTTHWQNIKEIKQPIARLRYFIELIFPPKEFMLKKYGIQSKEPRAKIQDTGTKNEKKWLAKLLINNYWWLWYPYRWLIGLKGVIKLIIKKI